MLDYFKIFNGVCYFFLFFRIKKMPSIDLNQFLSENPLEYLDYLLKDFNALKKFNDFLKVFNFYHVERCEHEDCSQCLLALNLCYVYTEHIVQNKEEVEELKNYCKMRKEQFVCAHIFIHRLAEIERQRLYLEKSFHKTLSLWNNTEKSFHKTLSLWNNTETEMR